ncbi:MAG TPA: hypothetical protein VGM69_26765 [Chloroflexota bacterium]|jgi:hypothetical protein
MDFNVTLISPEGYRFAYLLTDTCRFAAYGLRSLGHRCDLTVNTIETGKTNIVVGAHLVRPAEAEGIVRAGAPYVVVQSEWLAPGTAPGQIVSSFHGERFEAECRLLFERAQAIWEAYDWNAGMLRAWDVPPERIKPYRTIGYHEKMRDVEHRPWDEKDIDLLFFGSVTPRRQQVLEAVARRRRRVVAVLDAPAEFRNDLIARTKLNLNLNADERYPHLSLGRVGYLLNNRCALVSERATTHHEVQALVECAPYEQLADTCERLLAGGRLAELADDSYQRFQALPMTDELRRVL